MGGGIVVPISAGMLVSSSHRVLCQSAVPSGSCAPYKFEKLQVDMLQERHGAARTGKQCDLRPAPGGSPDGPAHLLI